MHILSRQIRFSLDPFCDQTFEGANAYASKPGTEGLGFYFSLWVDLASPLDPNTGFVVNVSNIDQVVRRDVVPLFSQRLRQSFEIRQIPSLDSLTNVMITAWDAIEDSFYPKKVNQLRLDLTPFKQISIQSNEADMFIYTEKFEFSAMHQLWNDNFSSEKNFDVFGKCANLAGHGHNYVLEISVERNINAQEQNWLAGFHETVKEHFLDLVDHKNLNIDVAGFESLNPTVENLSFFAWQKLEPVLKTTKLSKIVIWENDRTYCSYTKSE